MSENNEDIIKASNYKEFAKLRVGTKTLDDTTVNLGSLKKVNRILADRDQILNAINNRDYPFLREVSNFFFETSGIYGRLVRYLAYLYRYDWMVVPYIETDKIKEEKVLTEFSKVLTFLDNFNAKLVFGEIALKTVRNGVYYGYIIESKDKLIIQELPVEYCRSRYFVNGKPLVEFNVKFFDEKFSNTQQRMNVLKSFPKEFAKYYIAYKEGKLKQDPGQTGAWAVLDSSYARKFCLNNSEMPMLIPVIPAIIDLDEAQDLDKKKMMQDLLKIVIQKMPLDKNGELIFDVDEARELHNNAVTMLSKAIGVDILTTFADIDVENLSDKNSSTTTKDDLQKVERAVYNEAGISQMLFATDGNLALEKSVANDEATMYNLLLQFEEFMNDILKFNFNKNPKKLLFKVNMLTTSIYNFKDMSKLYKEQATLGYSKMLPQIALGQSQSSILSTAYFENQILSLSELMIPLQSSNTMSGETPSGSKKSSSNKNSNSEEENNNKIIETKKESGRPEKDDSEKSEKTIQNRESMS
ncbi:MAG: hypothetical protein HUJ68_11910 [Clostridia bacterium]|nr:hypothetical protein [Clostridia bacterium]